MARTETSPEPGIGEKDRTPPGDGAAGEIAGYDDTDSADGIGALVRELAEDTRTLLLQEVELVRLETARAIRRVAVDTGWIWAGAVVLTVGLICLALALALGIGALLDSYWLGALITGGVLLLAGGLLAWRGVRDLRAGGLMPSGPLRSLRENREWAQQELDDLKKGITEG